MGILNVTPDSFSDGGRYVESGTAVQRGIDMVAEGASIIDVGGESTRPGAEPVDPREETRRTVGVVGELTGRGIRVSIDTRRADVARAAVDAGATVINDVSASLWEVAAELGVGWIAMHMAGEPATMQSDPAYVDVVGEVYDHLMARADLAVRSGVPDVWIDPGIGFGKTVGHNLTLLAGLDRFASGPFPVVVGVSRKSLLGVLTEASDAEVAGRAPGDPAGFDDRLAAGVALAAWCALSGAAILRVHDVAVHVAAVRALEALGESPRASGPGSGPAVTI